MNFISSLIKSSTFFSKQARKPTGIFGRYYMSRLFEKGNAELGDLVREITALGNNDLALEIGFGTGKLMADMAASLEKGCIEGVDFSESMVRIAREKNLKQIEKGRIKLRLGDFDEEVFEDSRYHRIFSVNTIYFWRKPEITIAKINRLLAPGGKLVLGFIDKDQMEKMPLSRDVFRYYTPDMAADLLAEHGSLKNVEIISKKGEQATCFCAVGIK